MTVCQGTSNSYRLTLNLITNVVIVKAAHGKMLIHHSTTFKLLLGWEDLNSSLRSSKMLFPFPARIEIVSVHYKQKDWPAARNRQYFALAREQTVPVYKLHLNCQHRSLRPKEIK